MAINKYDKGTGDKTRVRKVSCVSGELDIKPLSTNKMYTGRKRKSVWYKAYQREVHKKLEESGLFDPTKKVVGTYKLELEIGVSNSAFDASNAIKPFEDILSGHFKFNDKIIFFVSCRKYVVYKGEEFLRFKFAQFRGQWDLRKGGCKR